MKALARSAAVAVLLAVLILPGAAAAKPHNPFDRTLGSWIGGGGSLGLCPVLPPQTVRRCTLSDTDVKLHTEVFGKYPHVPGHIVRFRLLAGTPTADTTAVSVRFRAIGGPLGPAARRAAGSGCPSRTNTLTEAPCANSPPTCPSSPATAWRSTSSSTQTGSAKGRHRSANVRRRR